MEIGGRWFVTGGAGFIGANFVKLLCTKGVRDIMVLDALTYAGNLESIAEEIEKGQIKFVKGNILDSDLVARLLKQFKPNYIVNFAAESHVDRSVSDPRPFLETNIMGAQAMLECARTYLAEGGDLRKFVQISTDEVYGDLDINFEQPQRDEVASHMLGRSVNVYGSQSFTESSAIKPSSPYSASKASADMMALAYWRTFGLPVVVTRCSNNYGPYQFPEKLIPLMINNMLEDRELPVYGNGSNVRDWIYVGDHCSGVYKAAIEGVPGEIYNFGGYGECTNLKLVKTLIDTVRKHTVERPEYSALPKNRDNIGENLIRFVKDRPGHDRRYAIDASKSIKALNWKPETDFEEGITKTVEWYLANREWVKNTTGGQYRQYYDQMYSKL